MRTTVFFLVLALIIVALVLRLLRSRVLREKYALLWIVVGVTVLVLAIFPPLLHGVATALGFAVPSNLLFLLGMLLLLGVTLHLSLELSTLEDETRVLAEEAAMARLAQERLERRLERLEAETAAPADRRPSDRQHVPGEGAHAVPVAAPEGPGEGERGVRA